MKSRNLILALAAWAFSLALPSWAEERPQVEIKVAQSEFAPPPTGADNAPATKGDLRWYWEQNERRWREFRDENERRWETSERRWEMNERRWREDDERRRRESRAEKDRQWERNNEHLRQLSQEIHNMHLAIWVSMAAIIAILLVSPILEKRERERISSKNAAAAMAALQIIVVGAMTLGMTAVVLAN